jgi:hypothetical protein
MPVNEVENGRTASLRALEARFQQVMLVCHHLALRTSEAALKQVDDCRASSSITATLKSETDLQAKGLPADRIQEGKRDQFVV